MAARSMPDEYLCARCAVRRGARRDLPACETYGGALVASTRRINALLILSSPGRSWCARRYVRASREADSLGGSAGGDLGTTTHQTGWGGGGPHDVRALYRRGGVCKVRRVQNIRGQRRRPRWMFLHAPSVSPWGG